MIMYTCGEEYTDSGIAITIDNKDGLKRITSLLVEFPLVQEGSGNPSSSNIRPFVRWNHVKVEPNMYEADVDLVGGTLDVYENTLTTRYVYINSYNGQPLEEPWMSDRDVYVAGTTPSIGAQVVYESSSESVITPILINRVLPVGTVTVTTDITGTYINEENYSGELVTFTANAEVPLYIKVPLEPVQECTPWMSELESVPYTFRQSPQLGNDYNREYDKLVGGTVAWNQLLRNQAYSTSSDGLTFTVDDDGLLTISGTSTKQSGYFNFYEPNNPPTLTDGHVYFINIMPKVDSGATNMNVVAMLYGGGGNIACYSKGGTIRKQNGATTGFSTLYTRPSYTFDGTFSFYRNVTDLTLALGTTIADYVYTLEQGTAGAGVAWLKSHFPRMFDQYNAYEPGALEPVSGVSAHEMTGFNQWDEEWEVGAYNGANGAKVSTNDRIRCKNKIRVLPNTTYYIRSNVNIQLYEYDADENFIRQKWSGSKNGTTTADSNAHYFTFNTSANSGTTYNHDICINISDPALNGTYQPYTVHSYALDSSLTLRGIPKLDASNNLYYDGDTYASDGTVTRKYHVEVFDGSDMTGWSVAMSTGGNHYRAYKYFSSGANAVKSNPNGLPNIVGLECNRFPSGSWQIVYDGGGVIGQTGQAIGFGLDSLGITTVAELTTWLTNNPLEIVYELATVRTETADPFTTPKEVDPNGTEEYVTTSIVPVGHETTYSLVCPIEGWDEVTVNRTGINIWDEEWEVGEYDNTGQKTSGSGVRCKTHIPVLPSTNYYLLSPNILYVCFYDADKNFISRNTYGGNTVRTTPNNAYYMTFNTASAYGTTYNNDISINYPSSDTDYHPYQGTSETISFPSTVYGGVLDVLSGVLTITMAGVDLGTLNWVYQANLSRFYTTGIRGTSAKPASLADVNAICSAYALSASGNNGTFLIGTDGTLYIWDSSYADATSFKNGVTGQTLVYELETPQEIQLTPTQIDALIGTNNVWVDTGDVYVKLYNPYDVDDQAFMNMEYYDMIAHEGKMCGKYIVPIIGAKCPSNIEPYVKGKPKLPRCN